MEFVIQKMLQNAPLVGLGLVFMAGILGGLDTCTITRIPLVLGVVGASNSRRKAIFITIFFIAGFILSYTALGALLGYFGSTAFKLIKINKYIFWGLGTLLLISGLLVAGLIPVKFNFRPHFIGRLTKYGYLGTFLLGSVFAFFEMPTYPCCGPLLLFLAGIAVTKKLSLAILIFLTLALGQSLPLILAGTATSYLKYLSPKISKYEEVIQFFSGNLLIIMALYFIISG